MLKHYWQHLDPLFALLVAVFFVTMAVGSGQLWVLLMVPFMFFAAAGRAHVMYCHEGER